MTNPEDLTAKGFQLNVTRGYSSVTPEELADLITDRIELAVVQRVPQRLLDRMQEGTQWVYPLHGMIGGTYQVLRFARRGNVLEFTFELDGYPVATFRFAGDHILDSGGT